MSRGINKFAHSPDVDTGDIGSTGLDMWDLKRNYNWIPSPRKLWIASDNVADVGNLLAIGGLDNNGLEQTQYVTLNGQTPVQIPSIWYRTFRGFGIDGGGIPLVGQVYASWEDTFTGGVPDNLDTCVLSIKPLYQQTLMSPYTLPADEYGVMKFVYAGGVPVSTTQARAYKIGLFARDPGGCFACKGYVGGMTTGDNYIPMPLLRNEPISALTDLVFRTLAVSGNNVEPVGGFQIKYVRKRATVRPLKLVGV